ncbi:MAG: S9 family peptidase [Candidatus Sabulitectum sp.]|nr:S9 family peptidase [Candidatus Sabulitectum sp.]
MLDRVDSSLPVHLHIFALTNNEIQFLSIVKAELMPRLCLLLLLGILTSSSAIDYMEPEQTLIDIVDAPWSPRISISPDFKWCLLATPRKNTSILEMFQPELKLAGIRFRPETFAPTRITVYTEIVLMNMETLETHSISGLPDELRSLSRVWSSDGSMAAITNETSEGIELWLIETASLSARRLTEPVLNLTARAYPQWLPAGNGVLACTRVDNLELPQNNPVPAGPVVQETTGEEAPVRTLQDLLRSPHDEELFNYYLTSQLSVIALDGSVSEVGPPGIIWDFDPAPGEELVLVHSLHEPFSYSLTASRFPMRIDVRSLEGNTIHTVADLPVRDNIPLTIGSVYNGPRSVEWRADVPATLCWAEALDGGDAGKQADLRDKVFLMVAPFEEEAVELAVLENRYGGIEWGTDSLALISEWWWPTRNIKTWLIEPANLSVPGKLIFDYSWEDAYNDPGEPITIRNEMGRPVLFSPEGKSIWMSGDGASPEGNIPFLKKTDLATLQTETVFSSEAPCYERPMAFTDCSGENLLFLRETPQEYPNYFIRNLADNTNRRITDFPYPTPQLLGISKELITYSRADGLELSATLYTPPGYSPDDSVLPVVVWAYPEEFISSTAAAQITSSPYEFDYIGWWSPLIWLTRGYAVLDDPSMPIVGENGTSPNDTYIEQLVMNAEAAVNAVVEMGIGDRDRFVIGGHSYGAFMTVNLLAHSDIFAAGLARSGAYNRTLTPFGFQSEDRSLWEASDVYWQMSPFMFADRINEPLLIIHGAEDSNSGTFPIQSERLFGAIKGMGGTARLVMLPLEGHSYAARESVLHTLWETGNWLDQHANTDRDTH